LWNHLTISKYEAVNYFARKTKETHQKKEEKEEEAGRRGRYPQLNHGVGDWTL